MRAILAAVAALLLVPAGAAADGSRWSPAAVPFTDLADGAGLVQPTAYGGAVVASRLRADGRYELVAWTRATGLRVVPGVPTRAVPFDADAGPDAIGAPAVVFSRCAVDGVPAGIFPAVDLSGARGCTVQIAPADGSAAPEPLKLRGANGLSLTTPSLWKGAVAAAAAPRRGARDARILLWDSPSARPKPLRGGTPAARTSRAAVDALDLGQHAVAFLWRLTVAPYGAGPGVEARWSPRNGRPGRQVQPAQGYVSGACGYRQPVGIGAPASGRGLRTLVAQAPCSPTATTFLAVDAARPTTPRGLRPDGVLAYGAAWDGDTVYWLRGSPPPLVHGQEAVITVERALPCSRPELACRLVATRAPALAPAR